MELWSTRVRNRDELQGYTFGSSRFEQNMDAIFMRKLALLVQKPTNLAPFNEFEIFEDNKTTSGQAERSP